MEQIMWEVVSREKSQLFVDFLVIHNSRKISYVSTLPTSKEKEKIHPFGQKKYKYIGDSA